MDELVALLIAALIRMIERRRERAKLGGKPQQPPMQMRGTVRPQAKSHRIAKRQTLAREPLIQRRDIAHVRAAKPKPPAPVVDLSPTAIREALILDAMLR